LAPATLDVTAIALVALAIALFLGIALFVAITITFAALAIALSVACHPEAWAARRWKQRGGVIIKHAIYQSGK
jgi:hypothetical protein